jgi:hypothetical protein
MPVALPERTVDAWVAAYVVQRVPDTLLWAPTQRQTPDYDIAAALPGPGKLFVLEDKAPYANGHFWFGIPIRQLWNYLRDAELRTRTFYVLPCPPFPTTEVPGAHGAVAPAQPRLVPRRARSRLAGHPWPPGQPLEDWFRVVSALDLWSALLPAAALPPVDSAFWPVPRKGVPPAGAPPTTAVTLNCPLPKNLGESLRTFIDRLLKCDRAELRVDPRRSRETFAERAHEGDSPVYQALIAYAPASSLPGWSD